MAFYGKIHIYGTLHLKRKENLMSSSDDYHRHRLRTTTKYFKVSVKPFQRLGGVRGGSPGKNLRKKRKVNGNLTRRSLRE